jgi:hypothetical protein
MRATIRTARDFRAHWERIYGEKRPDEVSWFEPTPRISLERIDEAGIDRGAPVVDRHDRDAYLSTLRRSLAPDGQLVVATFGPEAPPTCSGLPVHGYAADQLAELLPDFELASSREMLHRTPGGKEQQFVYARFVRS